MSIPKHFSHGLLSLLLPLPGWVSFFPTKASVSTTVIMWVSFWEILAAWAAGVLQASTTQLQSGRRDRLQLCLFQFTTALWLCVACCLRCPSEQQSWMKFICVMSCMLPCLQHSSMPSAFSSHLLQRPLRTPLEDQKFMVFYHFLNALALEIQEWSWKVSLESISINAAETTLEDFYLELHSLSSLFYRRASLSFFFLFTVNSGSKEVWQLWD